MYSMKNNAIAILSFVIIGIAATVVAFGIVYSSYPNTPEVSDTTSNTTITELNSPTFVPASTFTSEQVKVIQEAVCDEPWRIDETVPERISFAYLQPSEPIYRIACGIGPPGLHFQQFYFTEDNPAILLENVNGSLQLFRVDSPQKAVEYAVHFGLVGYGDTGLIELIDKEDEYVEWSEQCTRIREQQDSTPTESPVRMPTVTSLEDQGYVVQVNYISMIGGTFEYAKFTVTREGVLEEVEDKNLGHCGFAI